MDDIPSSKTSGEPIDHIVFSSFQITPKVAVPKSEYLFYILLIQMFQEEYLSAEEALFAEWDIMSGGYPVVA